MVKLVTMLVSAGNLMKTKDANALPSRLAAHCRIHATGGVFCCANQSMPETCPLEPEAHGGTMARIGKIWCLCGKPIAKKKGKTPSLPGSTFPN